MDGVRTPGDFGAVAAMIIFPTERYCRWSTIFETPREINDGTKYHCETRVSGKKITRLGRINHSPHSNDPGALGIDREGVGKPVSVAAGLCCNRIYFWLTMEADSGRNRRPSPLGAAWIHSPRSENFCEAFGQWLGQGPLGIRLVCSAINLQLPFCRTQTSV